jgi:hypothetical protein
MFAKYGRAEEIAANRADMFREVGEDYRDGEETGRYLPIQIQITVIAG